MRKAGLAAAALLALASLAGAGGLDESVQAAPAARWTGCYVGGHTP
jgi:opacity protein-like surface antigen